MAHNTEPNAMIEPTDRSMPPVRITRVIPIATMPLLDTCRSTSDRFPVPKNMLTPLDDTGDVTTPTTSKTRRLQYNLVLSRNALSASVNASDTKVSLQFLNAAPVLEPVASLGGAFLSLGPASSIHL